MAQKQKTYERVKEAHAAGGYAFTDPAQIAEQRGIVMDIVKQLASNVTQAKNLISVSLPVRLFEPRSYLERLTDSWCYAPVFLKKAAGGVFGYAHFTNDVECTDPVERLRLVVTFAIAGLQNTCKQKKPFNPILGETFEGTFSDGTQICCEQTAHHPPITAWQVFGPDNLYKFYGYGEWTASFSVNSITGAQKGIHILEFKDGTVIKYILPEIVVRGIMWGDRIMEYTGTIFFRDITNNLCAKVSIPPPNEGGFLSNWWSGTTVPPTDYLRGELYRFTVGQEGDEVKGEVINQINGSWLGALEFDDKQYWSIKQALPPAVAQPIPNPLPSDCRFRDDLVSLKAGNMQEAHDNKIKLEEKQRRDRKLRAAAAAAKGIPPSGEAH